MLPVIALVGRPNVGKSTLFNNLTRTRDALVADMPGLTRDRLYGSGKVAEHSFIVVDTGGLSGEEGGIDAMMAHQAMLAIEEADAVLFLVDGRDGLTSADEMVADRLRKSGKPVFLTVNKTEGMRRDVVTAEFHRLGVGEPHAIAATKGSGVSVLMDEVFAVIPAGEEEVEDESAGIRIAVIGRPNVGKSTLINRMLGEERVLAFDMPGTTRDSIFIPFERDGQAYTFIDTAGVRRRSRVKETIEKFSVIKSLQAIEAAHVVILVLDAHEGVSEQDAWLAGFAVEQGRAMVVAVNKWDGMDKDERAQVRNDIDRRLPFLDFAKTHFISALHGSGVGDLFASIHQAYRAATRNLATPELTRILEAAVATHQPPLVHGRRIKLRYAHQGGQNPPLIIIHGNQTGSVPDAYRRFLINTFRKALHLKGTPVRIEFKAGENPFAGRRNKLTPRQIKSRQRLKKFVSKSKK